MKNPFIVPNPDSTLFMLNQEGTEPWINAIGRLILNFGAVEALSFGWIGALSKDMVVHDLAIDMPLSKRLELIYQLIDRAELPNKFKREMISSWREIQKFIELRNTIAHNPLLFSWRGSDKSGPPDFIGIPNLKLARRRRNSYALHIELTKLNESIDRMAVIIQMLEKGLDKLDQSNNK
jgi:hypothetical protein